MEDKKIIRQCKSLAEKECANYSNRMCIPEDRPCFVINSHYPSIRDGAIDCDWFMQAILPGCAELNKLVLHELFCDGTSAASGTRKCEKCGAPYVPSSPRQKYCVSCGKAVKKQQNQEKQRRHNERLREKRLIHKEQYDQNHFG